MHPPFAKLLFGFAGWFVGFDGNFNFENIGDNYTENHVPYVGMRALPAILGSLTIPVVYGIMKESGYGNVIAAFSASIVLFGAYNLSVVCGWLSTLPFCRADNAHVAQSRLILLDATLIFFLSLTMYSYIRFRKLRYSYVQPFPSFKPRRSPPLRAFTPEWWGWLIATGIFMACTWGSKVNGVLAVFAIGIAVLVDLWDLLDIRKNPSMVRTRLSSESHSDTLSGTLLPPFRSPRNWVDPHSLHRLPIVFLDSLCHSYPLGHRRYLHEPPVPGELGRKRVIDEQHW